MKQPPFFTPIDLQAWPRREHFHYFDQMAPTGYSLTAEVDVTHMRAVLKAAGLKFFPAWLWLVTRTLNGQPEFKLAAKDGRLVYYHTLTPLYAAFHPDDKTFSLMWTEFDDDFSAFYRACLDNAQRYGHQHGILSRPDRLPPENAYTVSCVPWISFTHFAVHSYENKPYYFPSVEAGKFCERDGRLLMPLSLTCHHAAADGWHVHQFLEALQRDADRFETFLSPHQKD